MEVVPHSQDGTWSFSGAGISKFGVPSSASSPWKEVAESSGIWRYMPSELQVMVAFNLHSKSRPRRLTGLEVKRKECSAARGPMVTLAGLER